MKGYKKADEMKKKLYDQVTKEFANRKEEKKVVELSDDESIEQCISTVMYGACDDIRTRLLAIFGLKGTNENIASLVLFPSGSDAEFLPLVVALIRAKNAGGEITTLLYSLKSYHFHSLAITAISCV